LKVPSIVLANDKSLELQHGTKMSTCPIALMSGV